MDPSFRTHYGPTKSGSRACPGATSPRRSTVLGMASADEKVTVEVDAELVSRAREELGIAEQSDSAVVERALNAYLLARLLDATQARSDLSEEQAMRLANDELHAARRERRGAA